MNKVKANKLAKKYIDYIFNVCFHDCSDSMHEIDRIKAQWEMISEDESIVEYIIKNYYEMYQTELLRFILENFEEPTVMDLPIPVDKSWLLSDRL